MVFLRTSLLCVGLASALRIDPTHSNARDLSSAWQDVANKTNRQQRLLKAIETHAQVVDCAGLDLKACKLKHLDEAFKLAPPGDVLEFGVHKGATVNHLATLAGGRRDVHGFDSFQGSLDSGLPKWEVTKFSAQEKDKGPEGSASQEKAAELHPDVKIHAGLFNASVPEFFRTLKDPVAFVHADCDLYSSTKYTLQYLFDDCDAFQIGTVLVFDELFGAEKWPGHKRPS